MLLNPDFGIPLYSPAQSRAAAGSVTLPALSEPTSRWHEKPKAMKPIPWCLMGAEQPDDEQDLQAVYTDDGSGALPWDWQDPQREREILGIADGLDLGIGICPDPVSVEAAAPHRVAGASFKGGTAHIEAIKRLMRQGEQLGFRRIWLFEARENMPVVTSGAASDEDGRRTPPRRVGSIDPVNDALLTAADAAQFVAVSRATWWRWDRSGKVPEGLRVRGARTRRWSRSELLRWVDRGCPSRRAWTAIKRGESGGSAIRKRWRS